MAEVGRRRHATPSTKLTLPNRSRAIRNVAVTQPELSKDQKPPGYGAVYGDSHEKAPAYATLNVVVGLTKPDKKRKHVDDSPVALDTSKKHKHILDTPVALDTIEERPFLLIAIKKRKLGDTVTFIHPAYALRERPKITMSEKRTTAKNRVVKQRYPAQKLVPGSKASIQRMLACLMPVIRLRKRELYDQIEQKFMKTDLEGAMDLVKMVYVDVDKKSFKGAQDAHSGFTTFVEKEFKAALKAKK